MFLKELNQLNKMPLDFYTDYLRLSCFIHFRFNNSGNKKERV